MAIKESKKKISRESPETQKDAELRVSHTQRLSISVPLDQLRAVDRLALLDLVPRLVADGGEGGIRCQLPALSAPWS